jgi:hypothetical protein
MSPKLFSSTNPVTVGLYTALAGLDVGCAWRFVQLYREPNSNNLNDHIHAANQFWRDQLSSVPMVNTMEVRSNLIDQIDMADYLRLFAQNVAPVIVAMDLPQELEALAMPTFALAGTL